MKETIEITKIDKKDGYRFISQKFNDEIYIFFDMDRLSFRAISGFCPHFGGPLKYKDHLLSCYWHGWKFNPKNLRCINHHFKKKIKEYTIIIKDNCLVITNEIISKNY